MLLPAELDRVRVVLVATRNPLNIGAAARAMSNFGFLRLRVVNPYEVAFRDARSAVGAAYLLANAEECQTVADAVADCSLVVGTTAVGQREILHPLHRLEAGAQLIRSRITESADEGRHRPANTVALVFGSEKRGLSNEDLSHCAWLMHIPTRAEHISMNLGQAVAICLYELVRDRDTAPAIGEKHPAGGAEIERVTMVLLDLLLMSGYMDEQRKASTAQIVRRLVRRMALDDGDAKLMLGMLRQILWKVRSGGNIEP